MDVPRKGVEEGLRASVEEHDSENTLTANIYHFTHLLTAFSTHKGNDVRHTKQMLLFFSNPSLHVASYYVTINGNFQS